MENIIALSSGLVSTGSVEVMAIAAGASGTVYLTGYFTQSLNGQNAAGGRDAFLAKLDQGTVSWLQPLGSGANDHATSVAIDSAGDIYIAGTTGGGLSGETNSGAEDAFVAKYSPSGAQTWVKLLGKR